MSQTVSVIIPVYNVEKYLDRCVESLLNQTYGDLEIILVDDGSRDNSLEVCRRLAQRDDRVKVFHQENQGVSAARNAGLDLARGAYISFIDGDDYVKPDYFQRLLADLKEHEADIACCNFLEISDWKEVMADIPHVARARVAERGEYFRDLVEHKEAYGCSACAKLFKAEVAKQIRFKPLKFGEDHMYMYEIFRTFPRVYLDDYAGYYYVRNEASATVSTGFFNIPRVLDELYMYRYKLEHLPQEVSELRRDYYEYYALTAHALARALVLSEDAETRKSNRKMVKKEVVQALEHPELISKRTKLYLRLYQYTPWLYRWLLLAKGVARNK